MMDGVEGPHYTFVDPRLCDDSKAMVEQARRLSKQLLTSRSNQIPATLDGLVAAQELCHADTPVKVNLTWVSNFAHARLCAEIGAAAITFPCDEVRLARPRGVQRPDRLTDAEGLRRLGHAAAKSSDGDGVGPR